MYSIKMKHVVVFCAFAILVAIVVAQAIYLQRHPLEASAQSLMPGIVASAKHLWHCGMHPQVIQDHPGECPICHMDLTPVNASDSTSGEKRKVAYWWDPMLGPSSIANHPGKSAMGMDMVPVYSEEAGPSVTINPNVQQNMGVRTASVTRGPLTRRVRAFGVLKIPEPRMHDISLKVGGWIDKLYADQEGMHVMAGEPLFDLYSPDLQVAEAELIGAIQAQKSLPAGTGQGLRRDSRNMVESSRQKLRLWNIAEQDIDAIAMADRPPRDVPIRSPATGHVQEKMIVQGSAVQPGMKLLRVADHGQLWLEAQVYEEQFALVKIGQEIQATIDGLPDRTFKGKIAFVYPHLDAMTRTLMVRMMVENPGLELKPGMYARADIITRPVPDAVQAPREAVIDTGTRQIAFVDTGSGHFEPRVVRMGLMGDDDNVQILQGLAPGEMVVTSGQFLMDVESRTLEATRKLSDAPMAAQTQPMAQSEGTP